MLAVSECVHACMRVFSLPVLWVTGLLLCASAHWVQRKEIRREKVNKMAGETTSITAACSTAHSDSPQREPSLPQTIHHSNKCKRFLSSAVTIPHTKFANHQPTSALTLQRWLTLSTTSTSLMKLCRGPFNRSPPTLGDQLLLRNVGGFSTKWWTSISPSSLAICCSGTDGSIYIPSPRDGLRIGGSEGRKRTEAGVGIGNGATD